jgi:two-component system, NarL family, invasion response regulator UvrY
MKILLADDHAILRDGLVKLIKSNYPFSSCEEASDGNELIAKAINYEYDLIIVDINMPSLNGIEAVKRIRSFNKIVKIIVLSMYSESQYGVRAIKNGATGYLTKQNAVEQLIKAIEVVLANKRFITPELAELLADSINANDQNTPLHESLSEREMVIYEHIVAGHKLKDIGNSLNITISTVSTFRDRILKKLNFTSNSDLVMYAIKNNLFPQQSNSL